MSLIFDTDEKIEAFVIVTLRSALRLYGKHQIKANRAYTPSAMLKRAGELTNLKFKRGEFQRAWEELGKLLPPEVTQGKPW